MQSLHRPAARVICFDADGRVLLLRWRDPHDGTVLWEPPGGGLDPGETPWQAARRELTEETGLDPAAIDNRFRPVERDTVWKGRHFVGEEQFFPAYFRTSRPDLSRAGLLPYERSELLGHEWIAPADLAALPDRLEPPALAEVIESLRARVIVLPGLGDSGPDHWQSLLQAADPDATRLRPSSWDHPVLDDWLSALDTAVALAAPNPTLVAHSLGTLLVAHWAKPVAGALLVAVPDPTAPSFPAVAPTFAHSPTIRLPFPSIVLASSTDPDSSLASARSTAEAWGSRFVETGHRPWPLARTLLDDLRQ